MICADLRAAGIESETPEGVADFHSLRGYSASQFVCSGASIKAVQTLARRSTPVTTLGHYAKVGVMDVAGAVEARPDPEKPPRKPAREPIATTETHGRIRMRCYSAGAAREGRFVAVPDADGREGSSPIVAESASGASPQPVTTTCVADDCRPVAATGGTEGVGFEPTDVLRRQRFSRPPSHSANTLTRQQLTTQTPGCCRTVAASCRMRRQLPIPISG
jgi:hypothetical protein